MIYLVEHDLGQYIIPMGESFTRNPEVNVSSHLCDSFAHLSEESSPSPPHWVVVHMCIQTEGDGLW
ncbi:hypothetical protein NEUTE2DRAFT_170534 [Neurospora tetrasperma FGSC 2509]|nr:hypothetical protein NEUTE2DRAFT_170534 [Neurospora tetrasperma FGSC 2509]